MVKVLFTFLFSLLLPFTCRSDDKWFSTGKVLVGGLAVDPKLKNGDPIPEAFYGTCVELLQTSSILNRARARVQTLHPDLRIQPCKLEAARLPGTRIIVLRTSAPERAYAQAYLDSVMNELLAWAKEMHMEKQGPLFAVMDEIVRENFLAEKQIKEAEQKGTKLDQLAEAKTKLQQDKIFHERLVAIAQKLENREPADGAIFSVIEWASAPVAVQPGSDLPELFKK